jgi:hypothetical protein
MTSRDLVEELETDPPSQEVTLVVHVPIRVKVHPTAPMPGTLDQYANSVMTTVDRKHWTVPPVTWSISKEDLAKLAKSRLNNPP